MLRRNKSWNSDEVKGLNDGKIDWSDRKYGSSQSFTLFVTKSNNLQKPQPQKEMAVR